MSGGGKTREGPAGAGEGAAAILLRYLQEQNRPHSAQDAFGNLQREHGLGKTAPDCHKGLLELHQILNSAALPILTTESPWLIVDGTAKAVVKALEQLAQQGKIKEKVYGKQKIYFPDQDRFGNVSDSELKGLDNEISELSCKVQTLQQNCRHMESELKELKGSMTTPEMVKEIEDLKKDCANYTEKLERIKSAANHVTPEEKEKVYNEKKLYCKEWRRRKRMATELLDAILEGYPKSKKQFFEEVGIETDEDFNVTLPTS